MIDFKNTLNSQEKNKKLIVVFPHPDDEAMASGGLLILAKKYGWDTTVVTLTTGQMGQCYINKNGKTLPEIRISELKSAVEVLGSNLIVGDFMDSKIRENKLSIKRWLIEILEKEKPSIVVTYDHSGFTGHPDHISLSVLLMEISKKVNSKFDLYWTSIPKFLSKKIISPDTINYLSLPTHKLNIGIHWFRKWVAIRKHASQKLEKGNPILFLYLAIFHHEWYHKVDLNKKYKYKFVDFKI